MSSRLYRSLRPRCRLYPFSKWRDLGCADQRTVPVTLASLGALKGVTWVCVEGMYDRTRRCAVVRRPCAADSVARHVSPAGDWLVHPQEAVRRAQPLTPVLSSTDSTAQTRRDVFRGKRQRSDRRGRSRRRAALLTALRGVRVAQEQQSTRRSSAVARWRPARVRRTRGQTRARRTCRQCGVRAFHAAAMIAVLQAGTTQEGRARAARRQRPGDRPGARVKPAGRRAPPP